MHHVKRWRSTLPVFWSRKIRPRGMYLGAFHKKKIKSYPHFFVKYLWVYIITSFVNCIITMFTLLECTCLARILDLGKPFKRTYQKIKHGYRKFKNKFHWKRKRIYLWLIVLVSFRFYSCISFVWIRILNLDWRLFLWKFLKLYNLFLSPCPKGNFNCWPTKWILHPTGGVSRINPFREYSDFQGRC